MVVVIGYRQVETTPVVTWRCRNPRIGNWEIESKVTGATSWELGVLWWAICTEMRSEIFWGKKCTSSKLTILVFDEIMYFIVRFLCTYTHIIYVYVYNTELCLDLCYTSSPAVHVEYSWPSESMYHVFLELGMVRYDWFRMQKVGEYTIHVFFGIRFSTGFPCLDLSWRPAVACPSSWVQPEKHRMLH